MEMVKKITTSRIYQSVWFGDIIQLNESTQDLNSKLAQSKIVVVPSRNEGFGMVILEAMAQDNIVISFKGNVGPDAIIKMERMVTLLSMKTSHNLRNK